MGTLLMMLVAVSPAHMTILSALQDNNVAPLPNNNSASPHAEQLDQLRNLASGNIVGRHVLKAELLALIDECGSIRMSDVEFVLFCAASADAIAHGPIQKRFAAGLADMLYKEACKLTNAVGPAQH